ncbi:MAG: hypothetical protein AAF570_04905 [Bacteroidota bacterium]
MKYRISTFWAAIFASCLIFSACKKDSNQPNQDSLFPNSIVSTDIDFIFSDDPDAFVGLTYVGREDKEMPDSRNGDLFDTDTFIFEAEFANSKVVEIWAHSDFGTSAAAQEYADKLTPRLGKLPEFMRDDLAYVVLHKGDAGAFSESAANFFVLYSDNMDTRISNNDLEETVFHETVHATLDEEHANSSAWTDAQAADNRFLTEYGADYPVREDLAETALFAYTMITHPGRLSDDTETWVRENIPNRWAFLQGIFQ